MSDREGAEAARIEQISERLAEVAKRLRDPETDDAAAQELAREAAELTAEASDEVVRRLRAAQEPAGDDG